MEIVVTPEDAFEQICIEYEYNPKFIKGKRHHPDEVLRRRRVAKTMRDLGYSYEKIGRAMSKHYTSIMLMVNDDQRARKNEQVKRRARAKREAQF